MPRFHITVSSASRDRMIDLRLVHRVDVSDHGAARDGETYTVHAVADDALIRTLEAAGYRVQVLADADEAGRRAQAEVGRGNRFVRPAR